MGKSRGWRNIVFGDVGILILLALAKLCLHILTNGQYGFHRDELALLDYARYPDWGYVEYPPLAPLVAHVSTALFGLSLVGVRLFAALAHSISMVLAGLMARELGGSRAAQVVAAVATAIAPASLSLSTIAQYTSFDYLWWVLIAYLMIRRLKSGDPRWWLGIGAAIGLGLMTKYSIAFLIAGIVVGVALTQTRRDLTSPWLWGGVGLALLIVLPNLIWQVQHGFISLDFLSSIHERDVCIGRAEGYIPEQFLLCANPFTIPLWIAGLCFYLFRRGGRRYRVVGWMYVVPFVLWLITQGRAYYLAPAYPMCLAAGAVSWEKWLASMSGEAAQVLRGITWGALAIGGILSGVIALPIAPVNSGLWDTVSEIHDTFVEEIGWPELTESVAGIYTSLSDADKAQAGILAGNYGEAGAINLYGPAHGLPQAISGINTYWLRGYGDPPPQVLIALGFQRDDVERLFTTCELAGQVTNRYGIFNEETTEYPGIFVCRGLRQPWPEFWRQFRWYG